MRGTRRAYAAATALACPLIGAASGFPVVGLLLGVAVGGGYALWFERGAAPAGAPTPGSGPQAGEILWRDTEQALRRLDQEAAGRDTIAEACQTLARAGRAAVESARAAPDEYNGERIRQLLITGCELVKVYRSAPGSVRADEVADRLQQTAEAIHATHDRANGERPLRTHMRVLDQELQATRSPGMNEASTNQEISVDALAEQAAQRPRDDTSRQTLEVFTEAASQAFDLDSAKHDQRERIDQIKSAFDWETPERFAENEARGVSQFADSIIASVRSSEMGSIHDHLTDLRMITKRLGNRLEPQGFLGRLFFNGRKALEQFSADWDTVGGQIEAVVATLEKDKRASCASIENLRQLREEAISNFRNMAAAIVAGRELLAEARKELETLREQARDKDDAVASAELRRREQQIDVFDRRLTNLEKSRAIAAGMIPTIQQTLHSEVVVSEELDMALTQTIPVMKQQLALTAEQVRQQERLQSLSATRQTTERMMEEISDRLKTNQEMVDEQVREGIASADKVAAFLEKIGTTIDEIDRRQAEAQSDRENARGKLQNAVEELGQRLARPAEEAPVVASENREGG